MKAAQDLEAHGFVIIPHVLKSNEIEALRTFFQTAAPGDHGVRNILQWEPIARLAQSKSIRRLMHSLLGPDAVAVRGIFFDKLPSANWKVPWHQDLTIAVQAQEDLPDYGPWSVKDGIPHVQPETQILEQMLTIRLHLDDCAASNGALKVIPGSHKFGKLASQELEKRTNQTPTVCEVTAGGALLMRPLLLHSSAPAASPSHRRVIHLEFAAAKLPQPLEWHTRV
jgi:ectoine hydroxylase-related dioxygenase (phytanoyl-CoA dioxygenase family)